MYKKNLALTSILLGSSLALSVGSFNPASAALLWDWSIVDTSNNLTSSGTLTTDGTTYNTSETYNVTAITGTSNVESTGQTITGLSSFYGPDNQLQWDGTNLLTTFNGISWSNSNGSEVNISYNLPNAFGITNRNYTSTENNYNVTSALLSPVPEPLNVLGAVAALGLGIGFKRQLALKKKDS